MIVIKDMEMPKKCGECDIYVCYRTWNGDPGDEFCGLTKEGVTYKTKPEWCPLSEAPERKTGKWIRHPEWEADGECGYECDQCGMGSDVDYNFCPNCGSKMEETE